MKKLIYEDINLKTKFSYAIYRSYNMTYLVYECDSNGHITFIGEFTKDKAYALVREKCK